MMGETLSDPNLTEGSHLMLEGMHLLPVRTVFTEQKTRTRVQGTVCAPAWNGASLDTYEIHMGETTVNGDPFAVLDGGKTDGCVCGRIADLSAWTI